MIVTAAVSIVAANCRACSSASIDQPAGIPGSFQDDTVG
jgi:hypothetical protein